MSDQLLNGRPAEDFELTAVAHGRRCELERDSAMVAGLTAEFPRDPVTDRRPVTDLILELGG